MKLGKRLGVGYYATVFEVVGNATSVVRLSSEEYDPAFYNELIRADYPCMAKIFLHGQWRWQKLLVGETMKRATHFVIVERLFPLSALQRRELKRFSSPMHVGGSFQTFQFDPNAANVDETTLDVAAFVRCLDASGYGLIDIDSQNVMQTASGILKVVDFGNL